MRSPGKSIALTILFLASLGLLFTGCATFMGGGGPAKAERGFRYFCNCGPNCKCLMNSVKPGNCTCNKPMVYKKILRETTDFYLVCSCPDCNCNALDPNNVAKCSCGKTLAGFPRLGKFTCACSGCDCDTQSNLPAKCPCGVEMKARQ